MDWASQLFAHYRSDPEIVDACGVILYTDAHACIKKVLADPDYWEALNEISGQHWAILSVKPAKGHTGYPTFREGKIGFLVPVWKEPSENHPIIETLGLDSTQDLPLLLVFIPDCQGGVAKFTLKLDDTEVERSYASLREKIKVVTEAIEGISPENRKNPNGIYQALDLVISNHKKWEFIKGGLSLWRKLLQFKP